MSFKYDFEKLKKAILFNTVEVLPTDPTQLDEEIQNLVYHANLSGQKIRHYIGFEISGQVHIGTGIASALKIKKLQEAGVNCSIWLADYHTYINNKLDGKLDTIRKVSNNYFGPVMLKCCEVVGCDISLIEILKAESVYQSIVNDNTFWNFDMQIGKELTLSRVLKSVSIMGKDAGENVEFTTLRYPVMQVADAFFMQTHLVHAGIDQRKCHVLMREVSTKLDKNFAINIGGKNIKPIAIHHKLLLGLEKPIHVEGSDTSEVSKMSKSKPDSAIWVHDSFEEILRKLKRAYCPQPRPEQSLEEIQNEQSLNPILDWCKYMIYPAGKDIFIERKAEWGGNVSFDSYDDLESVYFEGKLHPMDLKSGVAKCLADWFEPIREYTKMNQEGLELVNMYRK